MVPLIVLLKVKNPADVNTVRDLLAEQRRLSLAEPGCLRFEVYHSKAEPTQFVLCEHWASDAAVDAHRKARAFTTLYQPKVIPLVDRSPHPSELVE